MSANKLIDLNLLDQFGLGFKTYIDQKIETAVAAGTVDLVAGVEIIDGVLFVTRKNGSVSQYIISLPCMTCATQTNVASNDDINEMIALSAEETEQVAAYAGEPITNMAGCSIATTSADDIETMINDPDNLETTTTENVFYTDECSAETATVEETIAATSPTMSVPADGDETETETGEET